MAAKSTRETTSLHKGQACIYCRRRKMRCDGAKPFCGQCTKGNRQEDCEYTTEGQSQMETLENSISRLQARIHDLEHPATTRSTEEAVLLRPPYQYTNSPSGAFSPSARVATAEPPPDIIANVVDKFLQYGNQYHFFLYVPTFRASALQPYPIGHHSRPSESLLATVYFLGCLFSDNPTWKSRSQDFLAQALVYTAQGLSSTHPSKVLHTVQAEVLLANYFFSVGKLLEGRYHISISMSLCIGSGLNKIRPTESFSLYDNSGMSWKAGSPIEIGERIIAWWVTLSLDQSWAAACEINSYNDGIIAETETPWPLRIESYLQGQLLPWPAAARFNRTIESYLGRKVQDNTLRSSPLELVTKASILWKQAHLVKEATAAASMAPSSEATLDRINELRALLNALGDSDSANAPNLTLLLARCLVHAALICLYRMRTTTENIDKVTFSALAILEEFGKIDPGTKYLNPIFTMAWAQANHALFFVIGIVPSMSRHTAAMGRGVLAMDQFGSSWSSLTRYEVHKVREALANL